MLKTNIDSKLSKYKKLKCLHNLIKTAETIKSSCFCPFLSGFEVVYIYHKSECSSDIYEI